MIPKLKAEELVNKFLELQEKIDWGNSDLKTEANLIYEKNNIEYNKYYDELAKQSALIAVNEVLLIPYLLKDETWFYNEVKKEIEKL